MNKQILHIVYWVAMAVVFITLISFSAKKQQERKCEKISIFVDKEFQKYFIDEEDVLAMMTEGNRKIIKGLSKQAINIRHLENLIVNDRFVSEARVSISHTGDIEVKVKQNTPIARVFTKNNSFYIDENGLPLPLSAKYTARVPVVVCKYENVDKKNDFFASKEGESYLFLLNYIRKDEFWVKQVSELDLDALGEVKIHMQVGKQIIEFGQPVKIEDKFFRLNVFMKKILPTVGWNRYSKVSLKYKDQIVCE